MLGAVAASLTITSLVSASSASAAVPAFPDNLLVFPNRDFVSVQGYQDHVGQTATLEVTRPGVGVIGSAQAVVQAGDVAFEVNHPGGVCWGTGTGLKVTPDIRPGDVTSISFGGSAVGDTTVQDAFVTAPATLSGSTVTVTGHLGADVIPANTEQRIVEPALVNTAVAKRDVIAVPGPLVTSKNGSYQSGLELDTVNHTFTATYVFADPAVAAIAANPGLGERLLSWQLVDNAGNRQGITIAERGEVGGPGVGGCPNGPLQSGPPAPTSISAATVSSGTAIKLVWTPAVAIPGTPAITGYRATAVAATAVGGEQVEIGRRIAGQGSNGTTITGLSAAESYDVEVVAVSSAGQTFPPEHAIPVTDTTPPIVSASPLGGTYATPRSVTLTSNEAGSQIYYTTDGVDPVLSDILAGSARLYTGPIQVAADTDLKYAAFDPSNNVSLIGEQVYVITNTPTPDAPTFGAASAGPGTITLTWTANDPSITGYGVQTYDETGATVGALQETTATTLTVSGLTEGVKYFFTVAAQNANGYGPASAKLGPLSPTGAVVAAAGADQVANRGTTVTLDATGSTSVGATYAWSQLATGTTDPIAATDPDRVTLATPSALRTTFALPLYRYPMTNRALTFRVTVTVGAATRTDDVLVTPRADTVTISSAKFRINDFRVIGTSSTVGATVTVRSVPDANGNVIIYGVAPVTAAAPPATGGVYDFRLRSIATSPGRIVVDSNRGGTAGPFTVG